MNKIAQHYRVSILRVSFTKGMYNKGRPFCWGLYDNADLLYTSFSLTKIMNKAQDVYSNVIGWKQNHSTNYSAILK